jgi:hypothetical protein
VRPEEWVALTRFIQNACDR